MNQPLKVGVIGVGSLGQWHARVYSELDCVELVGVYDTDRKQAASIAKKYRTTAFDDMAALAQQIDAASVVVPTDMHLDVASALIQQNVHLLVEKPIASTTGEAETLVALAREKGVILQVGHIERFNPVMRSLEDVLDRPGFIEAVRLAPYPPPRRGQLPRGTEVSVVLDLMIHDLEIIFHLVRSEVSDIRAIGVSVLSPSEDIANVRLRFANGCVANVSASRISREKVRKIRVFQQNAYVSIDYQSQSGMVYRKKGNKISRTAIPVEKSEPLKNELRTFADCVSRRGEPVVSGDHASRALRLAVDICAEIRRGGS